MGFESSPEPEPDWRKIWWEEPWHHCWQAHIYIFPFLYLLNSLYNVNSIVGLRLDKRPMQRRTIFLFTNIMLLCFTLLTSLMMFIDPYTSNYYHYYYGSKVDIKLKGLEFLVNGMKLPCLTAAFSFVYIALMETTKFELYSKKLHNVKYFVVIVLLHFMVSSAIHLSLVLFHKEKQKKFFELVFLCLGLYLLFSFAISFLFAFNYLKIKHAIGDGNMDVQSIQSKKSKWRIKNNKCTIRRELLNGHDSGVNTPRIPGTPLNTSNRADPKATICTGCTNSTCDTTEEEKAVIPLDVFDKTPETGFKTHISVNSDTHDHYSKQGSSICADKGILDEDSEEVEEIGNWRYAKEEAESVASSIEIQINDLIDNEKDTSRNYKDNEISDGSTKNYLHSKSYHPKSYKEIEISDGSTKNYLHSKSYHPKSYKDIEISDGSASNYLHSKSYANSYKDNEITTILNYLHSKSYTKSHKDIEISDGATNNYLHSKSYTKSHKDIEISDGSATNFLHSKSCPKSYKDIEIPDGSTNNYLHSKSCPKSHKDMEIPDGSTINYLHSKSCTKSRKDIEISDGSANNYLHSKSYTKSHKDIEISDGSANNYLHSKSYIKSHKDIEIPEGSTNNYLHSKSCPKSYKDIEIPDGSTNKYLHSKSCTNICKDVDISDTSCDNYLHSNDIAVNNRLDKADVGDLGMSCHGFKCETYGTPSSVEKQTSEQTTESPIKFRENIVPAHSMTTETARCLSPDCRSDTPVRSLTSDTTITRCCYEPMNRSTPAFVDKSLKKLLMLTAVVIVSSFVYCVGIIFYISDLSKHYNVGKSWRMIGPSSILMGYSAWLVYQTIARLAELGMTATMSYLVRQPGFALCREKYNKGEKRILRFPFSRQLSKDARVRDYSYSSENISKTKVLYTSSI